MIALFTDFGWHGPYVGQMHAVLARGHSPPRVIDLMHDAPRFAPVAAGHLLAALVGDLPRGTILVGVVDPGVGTQRAPVVVEADGRRYVGPANGLFDIVSARATGAPRWWRITGLPERTSATFHGRDVFAPAAAALARGQGIGLPGEPMTPPATPGDDLAEVIYIDDFGNAMTGLRAPSGDRRLEVAGRSLPRGCTFADAAPGEALWLENSIGLAEVVVNQGSAATALDVAIGSPVAWSA
jgi:hypothetical protein